MEHRIRRRPYLFLIPGASGGVGARSRLRAVGPESAEALSETSVIAPGGTLLDGPDRTGTLVAPLATTTTSLMCVRVEPSARIDRAGGNSRSISGAT